MVEHDPRGADILAGLRSLQIFYSEAAKLLKHGSTMMAARNWSVARSVACNSEGSKSIDWPRYWVPEDAFQFYTDEPDSFRLAYLAIIFDDIKQPTRITEPLLSCGWISFAPEYLYRSDKFSYRWCRLALAIEESLEANGVFREVPKKKVDPREYDRILMARAMALPLMKISGNNELEDLAIRPLLKDLAKSAGTTDLQPEN